LEPAAEGGHAEPFGVPVGQEHDGGAAAASGEKLGVDEVVGGPVGDDMAGEGEDVVGEAVVGGGRGGEPFAAGGEGGGDPFLQEGARVRLVGAAADVFEAPGEGADHAIVVGGPAAVFVATDALFKPVHSGPGRKRADEKYNGAGGGTQTGVRVRDGEGEAWVGVWKEKADPSLRSG